MKIIWFDIGSTMGWAHNCNGNIEYGQWDFTHAHNRAERLHETYQFVRTMLREIAAKYPIDVVGYERPFARGQAATRSLWGQAGVIEAAATAAALPVIDATPAEIKKFATGNGNATKEAMMLAASTFISLPEPMLKVREHEADAICGLFYALKHVHRSQDGQVS